jgi:membrane-associated phospholipid phosphatase
MTVIRVPLALLPALLLSAPLLADEPPLPAPESAQREAAAPADASPPAPTEPEEPHGPSLMSDVKAYFTAPVRWDRSDWGWFGASLLAIGAAHHYDEQVRTHFINKEGPTVGSKSEDLPDAIPAIALLGGTWVFAHFTEDRAGNLEAREMLEALGLSAVTAEALKFAAGRETPYQSSNDDEWGKGGSSFPSLHTTAAFAIGTVLAESGNDDYRWIRRVLGYGVGLATGYERLKHNAHWLSDTVAGAALGAASAHFVMNRHEADLEHTSRFAVVPVPGGAMLTYRLTLN